MDLSGRSPEPRRAGARILDTAEGVLIALRGCSLNQAFVEIVQTAKSHNVSTLSLADAPVAIAQTQASQDVDDAAFAAARATWGHLLHRTGPGRAVRPSPRRLDDDEDARASGAVGAVPSGSARPARSALDRVGVGFLDEVPAPNFFRRSSGESSPHY
jgi:hypothetical protein